MKQYLDLLSHCLNGSDRADRTGTGTRGVFGRQLRFDLEKGFPLLTTKKLHFKSIAHELLWIISGKTNIKYLQDNGVHIWDEWADEQGNLGPVYGKQWRSWDSVVFNDRKVFEVPEKQMVLDFPVTTLGVGALGDKSVYKGHPMRHKLYQTWYSMLRRCYSESHPAYKNYGGNGVFVDDAWLIFSNFFGDAQKLDNWNLKREYPDEYSLDKDFYGSNKYGPETCKWSSKIEQSVNISNNNNLFVATDPTGYSTVEYGLRPFCDKYKLCKPAVSQVLNGVYRTNDGWTFQRVFAPPGKLARLVRVDQLRKIIAEIKHNPCSRRIIVSAWNVLDLPRMKLEPCHCFFQFYVDHGKLSCQMYQRSADVFLGVPFNIASYALLTMMTAQVCGLEPYEFVHTFGDVHLYKNHLSQAVEQLSRDPRPLPRMILNPRVRNIDDFRYEDFELVDYNPHPHIRAEISV